MMPSAAAGVELRRPAELAGHDDQRLVEQLFPFEIDDQRRRYWRLTAAGRAVAVEEVRRMARVVDGARPWAMEDRR